MIYQVVLPAFLFFTQAFSNEVKPRGSGMVRNMNKEDWDKDDKLKKEMDMHRIADRCHFAADDNQCNQLDDCMVVRKGSGSGGGRPRGSGERPRGSGERPRGSGERPRGSGGRPRGSGERPRGSGERPRGSGERPRGSGERPRGSGERPRGSGERPRGSGERPRGSGGERPRGSGGERPRGSGGKPGPRGSGGGNDKPGPRGSGGRRGLLDAERRRGGGSGKSGPPRGSGEKPGPRGSGERPRGSGERPRGSGERPRGSGERPRGSGERPRGSGERPRGSGERPRGSGQRPRGSGERPRGSGERPRGSGGRPRGSGGNPFEPKRQPTCVSKCNTIKDMDKCKAMDDCMVGRKRVEDPRGSGGKPRGSGERPRGSGERPRGSGERPRGSGERPRGSGQRPRGSGERPRGSGERPRGSGERPRGSGERPRGSGERPRGSGERPRGSGEKPGPRGSGGNDKPGPRGSGGRRGLLEDTRKQRGSGGGKQQGGKPGPRGSGGKQRGSGGGKPRGSGGKPRGSGGKPRGSGEQRGSGGRVEYVEYCGPKPTPKIETGLKVKMTIYTDEDCKDMFEPKKEDRRRLQRNDKKDKKKPEETEKPGTKGGNVRQEKRIHENPSVRIISVEDDRGNRKCSFDSMTDRRIGRFRQTTCVEDNKLGVMTFDDVLCTEESEHQPQIPEMVNGACVPLKLGGGKGPRGSGSGKPGPRGSGGKPRGSGGRGRRLQEDDSLLDKLCGDSNNSFTDFIQSLICEEDEEDSEETVNKCDDLDNKKCRKAKGDGCVWKSGTCVDTNAKEGEKNFYVKYEWKSLTVEGKDTEEEFCYKAPEVPLASAAGHKAFCSVIEDKNDCTSYGCKYKKKKCEGQKKKIKCNKLKAAGEVSLEDVCDAFNPICEFDGKKCGGKGKFPSDKKDKKDKKDGRRL